MEKESGDNWTIAPINVREKKKKIKTVCVDWESNPRPSI
jgi:hypothetical protein